MLAMKTVLASFAASASSLDASNSLVLSLTRSSRCVYCLSNSSVMILNASDNSVNSSLKIFLEGTILMGNLIPVEYCIDSPPVDDNTLSCPPNFSSIAAPSPLVFLIPLLFLWRSL